VAAYQPSSSAVVLAVAGVLLAELWASYAVGRLKGLRAAQALSWLLLGLATAGVEALTRPEPPGVRMLALIGAALLGMKAVVVAAERARGMPPLSFGRWLTFTAGWAGMQPRLFARPEPHGLPGARGLAAGGALRLLVGAVLVAAARAAWTSLHSRLLASALLLAGLSFVLHFGLLNVLAGLWRSQGVRCDALFRAPWRSQNLSEFWARRWNLAFSEMTQVAVYRPLVERFGPGPALAAAFLMSGLLHEMAISLPVRAGFGLPLLYFALHGGLVAVERALAASGRPLTGWPGRAWAVAWLVGPLPLLFHRPFLAGVVWPLAGIPPQD
jgi:hypothetical protein